MEDLKPNYDVVVVGSGASGGTVAARLARSGVDVLVLEGGPSIDTRTDFNTHGLPFQFPQRRVPIMRAGRAGFDSPRTCGVGGQTLRWNSVALRYSQRDFRGASAEGGGMDWPIDYADLSAYYSIVEREIGVCGNRDGLEDLPDGEFLPPLPLKRSDEIIQRGALKLGVKLVHTRKANLTVARQGRRACYFCGNCMAGCDVVAKYNSADVQLYPALRETGKLNIRPNSLVYELGVDDRTALVDRVKFFDRRSGETLSTRATVVVVAGGCQQSIALLLMSKSKRFPYGLGNGSGQVGRHFIPHFIYVLEGFLWELMGNREAICPGSLDHAYIPSFMHERLRDYPRSFGMQIGTQNSRHPLWASRIPGIGEDFKAAVRRRYPAHVQIASFMEITPNEGTFVDLEPYSTDHYGLPVPQTHWKFTDKDWNRWRDMRKWTQAVLRESAAETLEMVPQPLMAHELGGCRMGDDPNHSVVDPNCRVHEVTNLYVADGSVFPSASEKNPTLTIIALAARTADQIARDQFGRGTPEGLGCVEPSSLPLHDGRRSGESNSAERVSGEE